MLGFALPSAVNMFILMTLYDFGLLPAQLCYITIHIQRAESSVQIMGWCATWEIENGAEPLLLQGLDWIVGHLNYCWPLPAW
jgi:hypothetical protein